MNKVLSISKTLYLSYLLLFLFNNTTSYLVYIDNIFYLKNINKKLDSKQ